MEKRKHSRSKWRNTQDLNGETLKIEMEKKNTHGKTLKIEMEKEKHSRVKCKNTQG